MIHHFRAAERTIFQICCDSTAASLHMMSASPKKLLNVRAVTSSSKWACYKLQMTPRLHLNRHLTRLSSAAYPSLWQHFSLWTFNECFKDHSIQTWDSWVELSNLTILMMSSTWWHLLSFPWIFDRSHSYPRRKRACDWQTWTSVTKLFSVRSARVQETQTLHL